jgi:hypothetical protein
VSRVDYSPNRITRPPTAALTRCLFLVRTVEAACAWSTAARQLARSKIAAGNFRFTYHTLQLPRTPVVEYSAAEITSLWRTQAKWSDTLRKKLVDIMKEDMQTSKGAVHCEAGILAALCTTGSKECSAPKPSRGYRWPPRSGRIIPSL